MSCRESQWKCFMILAKMRWIKIIYMYALSEPRRIRDMNMCQCLHKAQITFNMFNKRRLYSWIWLLILMFVGNNDIRYRLVICQIMNTYKEYISATFFRAMLTGKLPFSFNFLLFCLSEIIELHFHNWAELQPGWIQLMNDPGPRIGTKRFSIGVQANTFGFDGTAPYMLTTYLFHLSEEKSWAEVQLID